MWQAQQILIFKDTFLVYFSIVGEIRHHNNDTFTDRDKAILILGLWSSGILHIFAG